MNERISACSGTFDGAPHKGHIFFLDEVRKTGSHLVVFVNTDDVIRRNKNREPIFPQSQRMEQIDKLAIATEVIAFEGDDEANLQQIMELQPHVYGFSEKNDYPFDKEVQRRLTPMGTVFVTIPAIEPQKYSTSNIYFPQS